MANPVLTALVADTWTKVATNVTSGFVAIANTNPKFYIHTYVDTGDPAPTDNDEAIQFDPSGIEEISASAGIDVYIKAVGAAGSVIVGV